MAKKALRRLRLQDNAGNEVTRPGCDGSPSATESYALTALCSASPQDGRQRDPTDKSAWNSDRRCQRIKSQSGSEPPNVRPRCEQPTEQRHRLPASSRKNLTTNQFALSKKYGSV